MALTPLKGVLKKLLAGSGCLSSLPIAKSYKIVLDLRRCTAQSSSVRGEPVLMLWAGNHFKIGFMTMSSDLGGR